jgi:hypothetical protein
MLASTPPYSGSTYLGTRYSLPQILPKEQPYVPIYPIYSTLKLLIKLARASTEDTHRTRLRRELERLFLWAESLSISGLDNKLDATLMKLPELYGTISFTVDELENVINNSLLEDATAGSSEERDFQILSVTFRCTSTVWWTFPRLLKFIYLMMLCDCPRYRRRGLKHKSIFMPRWTCEDVRRR